MKQNQLPIPNLLEDHNLPENDLLIINRPTIEALYREPNPTELVGLYLFYYKTAKWQKTNQIKCSLSFAAKGLHFNKNKISRIKQRLEELGLISSIKYIDPKTKQIKGWYVKLNYIIKNNPQTYHVKEVSQDTQMGTLEKMPSNQYVKTGIVNKKALRKEVFQGIQNPQGGESRLWNPVTQMLSNNNKMLKVNKLNALYTTLGLEGEFLEKFNLITGRKFKAIDNKTICQLKKINELGYTLEDISQALTNAASDRRLRGANDSKKDYLTPEYITRIGKFEDYLNQSMAANTSENWTEFDEFLLKLTGRKWHKSDKVVHQLYELDSQGIKGDDVAMAVSRMWKDQKIRKYFSLEFATKTENIDKYLNSYS